MPSAELDLVSKVDLRLALAESEAQLQQSLGQLLCPLILKLASVDSEVRQAVFKTIQNVFPRITAARSLQLPVENLLKQAKNPNVSNGTDSGSVRLYSLLFLSKGIERLDAEAQRALIPEVVRGISNVSTTVSARLFSILVKLLRDWKAPEKDSIDAENLRNALGFTESSNDENFLAMKIAKFLMLQPNSNPLPSQSPGLGVNDSAFFTRDAGVSYRSYNEITETKQRLLEFTKAGFSDAALALPLLLASTDSLSAIADTSYARYKKLTVDMESPILVDQLVSLYLGGGNAVPPVKPITQERILTVLCKSSFVVSHPKISEISNVGLSSIYVKLRQTAVAFVRKVTSAAKFNTSETGLGDEFNSQIAARLKESIISEGWPQMDSSRITNFRTAISSRELQYEALGDVLRHSRSLWRDDLSYLRFLFASLEGEVSDLVSTIQSVLSGLTIHLSSLSKNAKTELKTILKGYLQSSRKSATLSSCKYIAVKYVNCAFPFTDVEARLLCVYATAKENSLEVREEAEKGLHPYHFNLLSSSNTAEFTSSKQYLGQKSQVDFPLFTEFVALLRSSFISSEQEYVVNRSTERAIKFALSILVMQAINEKSTVVVVDEDWDRRLDKALEVDEYVRSLVVSEIETLSKSEDIPMHDKDEVSLPPFLTFVNLVFDAFYSSYFKGFNDAQRPDNGAIFALLVSLSPPSIIGALCHTIQRLTEILIEKTLPSKDLSTISNTLSIISTHETNDLAGVLDIVNAFAQNNTSSNGKEKYLAVTAHVLAKLALRKRTQGFDHTVLDKYLIATQNSLSDSRLYDTCVEGLSQLAIYGALGPILEQSGKVSSALASFMDIIALKVKSFNESAVIAFSKLALASPSTYSSNTEKLLPVEQKIFDTHTSKQIDYIFTCGDALSILAGGWSSKLLKQSMDIQNQSIAHVPAKTGRLGPILNHILNATRQNKPALRRAGCIWLLAVVQHLQNEPLIKTHATDIHSAFMRFLADRDEMVQEAAARGLSIVYDLGDRDLKDTLVKGLLRSFTDANAASALSSGTVDLETQLFDKDVLKTHDSSVSTYKDVLNLASDVGDPSLVYKFMSLAKSNALWSSRRGMAFGLGSILSKSSLDEMLSSNPNLSIRLIPKLYRYKFDPNQAVSRSMNGIWTSLIGDTQKVVSKYFDAILAEVLKGMGHKEWRVRQASTVALNNLLQTSSLEMYEAKLDEVWNMSFRSMDDIKESVRKEGQSLSKTLARILITSVDSNTGKVSASKAAEVLESLIPLFMGNKGLLSDVEDVRAFALEIILKLCDIGGNAIKQHVPSILSHLIELMSTLEPEVINYLVLNAEKYNIDSNDVDAKRLQGLNHSPMMDAIDKLMNQINEPMMPEVVRQIKHSVKNSIGLPSKVCGSRVIVSLVSKYNVIVRDFGDPLLTLCISQLKDRNDTVSQSYAIAAGHCCKIASVKSLVDYSKKIESMYIEAEDIKARKLAAIASEAVSRFSSADKFEPVASAFLPLAYVGKHDGDEGVSSSFEKEWVEYSSGNTAVKLYFPEIFAICEKNITSHDYNVRRIMAKTVVDVCQSVSTLQPQEVSLLFSLVLEACKGKSWEGKELVFEALITLSRKNRDYLLANNHLMDSVIGTILMEQKRRNKTYQLQVILSVGKFIKDFPEKKEVTLAYVDIMRSILTDEYLEDADIINFDSISEVEDFYLKYIRNSVETSPVDSFDSDMFAFAIESMKSFQKSGHTLTWKTCYSYNENFQTLLASWRSITLNEKQLKEVTKGLSLLVSFTEDYKLEKNAIIFARNAKLAMHLFKRHNKAQFAENLLKAVQDLLQRNISSVVRNELLMVIA